MAARGRSLQPPVLVALVVQTNVLLAVNQGRKINRFFVSLAFCEAALMDDVSAGKMTS